MDLYVSLDPGSSYMKAAHAAEVVRFPAVVAPCAPGAGLQIDGAWWVVGEDAVDAQARLQTDPQPGAEYHGSKVQRVLICEALRRLGLGRGEATSAGFVVGMPYVLAADTTVREDMRQVCAALAWAEPDGATCRVDPTSVRFPPQGGGALWEYAHDKGPELSGRVVCAIDIGGQTTDVVTVRYGSELGREQCIPAASASVGVNVHDFYTDLVDDLVTLPYAAASRQWMDYYTVMRRLERGELRLPIGPQRAVDMAASLARTRRAWTERLVRAVQRVVGQRWGDLAQVILTGGGAHLVDTDMWGGPVAHLDDLANVRGQLRCIQHHLAQPLCVAHQALARSNDD